MPQEGYEEKGGDVADTQRDTRWEPGAKVNRERMFDKGQSRRIWGELYKVLDSSDVVVQVIPSADEACRSSSSLSLTLSLSSPPLFPSSSLLSPAAPPSLLPQVLDARDPMGTRSRFLESHLRRNARHKHLVLLLNKCDLVPAWVTKRWLHYLSREFPTLAMHASITNPFGKAALLSVLRQFARLRQDKPAISVGFVGYPNVGKSSVINCLKAKAVCKSAPVPGETKVSADTASPALVCSLRDQGERRYGLLRSSLPSLTSLLSVPLMCTHASCPHVCGSHDLGEDLASRCLARGNRFSTSTSML